MYGGRGSVGRCRGGRGSASAAGDADKLPGIVVGRLERFTKVVDHSRSVAKTHRDVFDHARGSRPSAVGVGLALARVMRVEDVERSRAKRRGDADQIVSICLQRDERDVVISSDLHLL